MSDSKSPHRRFNPLLQEWVLVSPQRLNRPWLGDREETEPEIVPEFDPSCALCPGNRRASGEQNAHYTGTYWFPNDFPAVLPEAPAEDRASEHPLFQSRQVRGECRVLCFSPRHDLTLAHLQAPGLEAVIHLWKAQFQELDEKWNWVQIFENKGAAMGCSNPHPHGQVWATDELPTTPHREDIGQKSYWARNGRALLDDLAREELHRGERIVVANGLWVALVPFWAVWPFELLILPLEPIRTFHDVDAASGRALAELLADVLPRYDRLFATRFPYSFGWHGAPGRSDQPNAWRLHAHIFPPLLRSATVRKFMVGYEMLAEAQRDLTPEAAAARLREV